MPFPTLRTTCRALWLAAALASSACQAQTAAMPVKRNGLMLDIARRPYTPEIIRRYIDTLADNGGSFLHLHLSDHENYALESSLLGQTADHATFSDGLYRNPQTGKPFLSSRQVRELADYAAQKGIEIVPEVGSPNHMGGIFRLLELKQGAAALEAVKSKHNDDEIDITSERAAAFVENLLSEVAAQFPHSRRIHIGGDEFGYSVESNHEFVSYANRLAAFLKQKGLRAQIWNDGIIKANTGRLNRDIDITYWSFDGDTQDENDRRYRRQIRASLPELTAAGFQVWNYNSYYLYFVPARTRLSHDAEYARRDLQQNWHLGIWDGRRRDNAATDTPNLQGAALAVWGEDSAQHNSETVFRHSKSLLETFLRQAAYGIPPH